MYSRTAAQTIPAECLHGILDYLWDDHVIGTLHSRHRRRTKDYDQTLVHQVLRARNIAPLHVCQRWRVSSITRFFRNLFIDTSKPTELPESAYMLAERVFVVVTNNPVLKLKRMPQVRTLALCFVNNKCEGGLEGLKQMVPGLQYVWFQSIGKVSWYMYEILVDLRQSIGTQVSMAHMCFGGKQDTVAVDLVRELAEDLEILCLSRISGGVLSDLVQDTIYPRLRRLIFSVDIHANLFTNPRSSSPRQMHKSALPVLRHLHFDDTALRGAPREEWHAPLFDSLIKNAGHTLRYLTFPIVYNTGRTISRSNCPQLVELYHVKCCWATMGPWGNNTQLLSDSTRVLTDIASIPALRRYVHPSYIARLSDLPETVECRGLGYLDLFGWPLTMSNISWILRTFDKLKALRVTVAAASTSIVDIDVVRPAMSLERLDIGAVSDAGSLGDEMPQLIDIIEGVPRFCRVALFGAAYLYVKTHIAACVAVTDEYTGHRLRNIKLFNLDNVAAGGRFGSSRTDSGASTPWHNAAMTRTDTNTNTDTNAAAGGNNNSWHLVSRLLVE